MRRFVELLVILGITAAGYVWYRRRDLGGTVTVEDVVSDTVDSVKKTIDKITARGIRNNNPGNIIYDGTEWDGLDNPPSDGKFCRFVTPAKGFRALGHLLKNYKKLYGINTIRGIIMRWSETDQQAYIANVSRELELGPDQPFNISDWLGALAAAICRQENGNVPYNQSDIEQWVRLP